MDKKSLFVNGTEQLRIEKDRYLISSEDEVLVEVSRDEFVEELLKYSWTMNSWSKELRKQFNNILEELKKNGSTSNKENIKV